MRIGAVAYQPYVYNTNAVSAASLNRVSALPQDGTKGGVDYSPLVDDGENTNPLKKGQSANFEDIVSSQMAKSRSRSMALMKPAVQQKTNGADDEARQTAGVKDQMRQIGGVNEEAQQKTGRANVFADDEKAGSAVSYRMRQALDAYSAAMGVVA